MTTVQTPHLAVRKSKQQRGDLSYQESQSKLVAIAGSGSNFSQNLVQCAFSLAPFKGLKASQPGSWFFRRTWWDLGVNSLDTGAVRQEMV